MCFETAQIDGSISYLFLDMLTIKGPKFIASLEGELSWSGFCWNITYGSGELLEYVTSMNTKHLCLAYQSFWRYLLRRPMRYVKPSHIVNLPSFVLMKYNYTMPIEIVEDIGFYKYEAGGLSFKPAY